MGGDVGGGHGAEVHGDGRLVSSETPKADKLPGMWIITNRGVHDVTPPPHAQEQSQNRMELAASNADSTPTPGVRHNLYADNESVNLTLPRTTVILLHAERTALSLHQAELRGPDQDPGVAPQIPPSVRALWEPSASEAAQ